MSKLVCTAAVIAFGLTVAACSKDATGTNGDNPTGSSPITIPTLGSGLVAGRYTAEVAAAAGVAYTATWGSRPLPGNTTYVWNTASSKITLVDSLVVADAGTLGDVQISPDGHYLVVATERGIGSIVVYDRSMDPLHPTLVARFSSSNTTAGVHTMKMSVIEGRLYGFLQIDPGNGSASRETIVDMTNPQQITEIFSQVMGKPYVHDVYVRDGYLFAALWNNGLTIFDVGGTNGSPSNPVVVSTILTRTGQIHNVWWFHDPRNAEKKYAFLGEEGLGLVGASSSGDIHVIDVSVLSAPKEVAAYHVMGAGTHNFWVDEPSGVLYAAYYNGGVRAIDVRGDLSKCTAAQRSVVVGINGEPLCDLEKMGRLLGKALDGVGFYIWGVRGLGTRLYASDMNSGLVQLDITSLKR